MRRISGIAVLAAVAALILAAFLSRPPRAPVRPGRSSPSAEPPASPEPPARAPGAVSVFTVGGARPIGNVPLRLVNETLHAELQGDTDADGARFFPRVAPGAWTLYAKHPKYVLAVRSFSLGDGETATVSIELSTGGRLVGAVTDETGLPVTDAVVSVLDVASRKANPSLRTQSGSSGEFAIEGIPLGPAGLLVTSPRFRPYQRDDFVFARNGETIRADVGLKAGTTVSGRVVGDDEDVGLAAVLVSGSNEHTGIARTDPSGRFTLSGLGDQPVNLFAQSPGYGTVYVRNVAPNTAGLVIRLQRAGTVSGRVDASPPPAAFSVLFYRFEPDLQKKLLVLTRAVDNSSDGSFIVDGVAAGRYDVTIAAKGYTASTIEVLIGPGESLAGLIIPAASIK